MQEYHKGSIQDTIIAEYNSIESIRQVFTMYGEQIAAVIIEPVAGNMGGYPSPKRIFTRT